MCGISGIVDKRHVNPDAVEAMNALMCHRGPDGEGVWQSADGQVVLGHRRLAVIDPTPTGAQPMVAAGCLAGVDEVYGMHNWPSFPIGTMAVKVGCSGR